MKRKTAIILLAFSLIFSCLAFSGCGLTKWKERVDTYYKDGYILISTAERFKEVFVEGKSIPGYEVPGPGEAEPTGLQFEKSIIEQRGGIKGYKLTADLDFTNVDISSINPQYTKAKAGVDIIGEEDGNVGGFGYNNIDGDGFALTNIHMEGDFASVFGSLSRGVTIKNLTIKDSSFTGGNYLGAFLSYVDINNIYGTIKNCQVVNCTIGSETSNYVGAFAGYLTNARTGFTFSDISVNTCTVKGNREVGGAIGYYRSTKDSDADALISNVYVMYTNVTGYAEGTDSANVGGLIGSVTTYNSTVSVKNCASSFGTVTAKGGRVGGLIGYVYYKPISGLTIADNNKAYFENLINFNNVTGAKNVGGVVGESGRDYEEIRYYECGNYGTVTSLSTHAGGVCGQANIDANFTACFNGVTEDGYSNGNNNIAGEKYVGGICGEGGRFASCTNTMDIDYTGTAESYEFIDGIVGKTTYGVFDSCINTGRII